jgi:integrase
MMAVYKRGKVWWYKFTWRAELIRESTKQTNKRIAEQMEAARKTQHAKGEVGIKDRNAAPTLTNFLRETFLAFLQATKSQEPNTVAFYKACAENLLAWPKLGDARLDEIKAETLTGYIKRRQEAGMSVATINRELATLRRALRLANEWGALITTPPKITLLNGEAARERVLRFEEESAYLAAAEPLLRTAATIMLDCGLRPDEVYRLSWRENYRDGRVIVHTGKTRAARRSVPVTPRVAALLEMRKTDIEGWIFAARTKTGHIDQSSLRKAHLRALKSSEIVPFVLYDLRHTCLTRWAKHLDPFTLKKLAGHECLTTTMKYIHLNECDSDNRLIKARQKIEIDKKSAQGRHDSGHSYGIGCNDVSTGRENLKRGKGFWRARRGSNSRPIDSKSIALSN